MATSEHLGVLSDQTKLLQFCIQRGHFSGQEILDVMSANSFRISSDLISDIIHAH